MRLLLAAAAAGLLSTAAVAQTDAGSGSLTTNPALSLKPNGSPENTGAIAPGANSFTEGQARSRIEAQGFTGVSDLRKDDQGIWHGRAQHNGQSVEVMLDFRGNVASK
ncbi:PepSY domain-containing protein [Microvirga puerhi]|uniref:PepSY domain-containing protein n=1 Tax=Microvirga puerhi TaxID=2876078 RepID=A0ABS7VL70_9HYPH|nr:PepSY domain-containing protein [Microvirga puerhi]MBZ6076244.1 PepSY domain-containing protein [Microvirga puerhi]